MNMFTCAQVHDGICTPAAGPYSLFYFFFDAGGDGRVTDVSVDLYQEIAAYDHRFTFGVIDIIGDDGSAGSHFLSYKFGGDKFHRCIGAKGVSFVLLPEI